MVSPRCFLPSFFLMCMHGREKKEEEEGSSFQVAIIHAEKEEEEEESSVVFRQRRPMGRACFSFFYYALILTLSGNLLLLRLAGQDTHPKKRRDGRADGRADSLNRSISLPPSPLRRVTEDQTPLSLETCSIITNSQFLLLNFVGFGVATVAG